MRRSRGRPAGPATGRAAARRCRRRRCRRRRNCRPRRGRGRPRVSLLYVGTFGSFIGFGFAFGQVLQVQFAADFATPVRAAYLTFLGPLLGSLSRPLGGRVADRTGGARVTFWIFVAMAPAAGLVLPASARRSPALFVAGFVLLFVLSGAGNGSTFKMIPAIFRAKHAEQEARRRSGALIGLAGAIGAFGGVLVNLAFRQSFLAYGSGDGAYAALIGFYLLCAAVTWAVYLRRPARERT